MTTFADLGIPFPLFAAPTGEASEYVGLAACVLCGRPRQHCFVLRIGCAVLLPCPACATLNGLDTSDRRATPCRVCHREVPFPDGLKDKTINVCYACLRAGKAAITKDTEFGMASWEQAFAGVTHGVPGLRTDEFETVLVDAEEDWYGVRLATMHRVKGLEFPVMILAGVNSKAMPLRLAAVEGDPTARKEHEDRERSLLFVAATRARDQLIVTSWGVPSPFLSSIAKVGGKAP